ncbi:aldo/keto reductase [Weissella paramesenteroides]|jgi:2,5-diketo-D-gluconate reductase A|uniref:Oxidoreductase, aldo/keto reductase family protein n=2 Tax=Weissella paramesenteroides TaxID=1249 RepID=C5R8P9_WEIPA|nr:aldo/keto reductase [Weissella paramesenteroides]ATF40669.1 aldo/keto reductase [Weissella paramesenteroides]EER75543.1 oxidoreductase, aldo/keto reductase family protein [Weissella paramesenteroides ATCC 33313]KAA8442105.1 aldo/keto reductase [Weissella paramesenteroides]KAA8442349.1 aldo/keto reductase [Weissella paramesenteroides]KAA8443743.1 aldo/keto reductase [Weissella paramesenteroides]
MSIPNITLNDGHQLPNLGLGTYQLKGGAGFQQILAAIKSGYRLIDSATNYDNEGIVGKAIRHSGVPRSEFFITSKLPGKYHDYESARDAIQESLARMGIDYFDLFIIHWPLPKRGLYVEAWQALVDAQKQGLIRSIGVSNFEPEHLDRIIEETGVKPAVNQIEIHPYWVQEDNVLENLRRGIKVEAWSPLGRGSAALKEPVIQKIAEKYGKSTSQIITRWHIDRGIIPVLRSSNPAHQREDLDVFDFELENNEIAAINDLNREDGRIDGQDPNEYEEFE